VWKKTPVTLRAAVISAGAIILAALIGLLAAWLRPAPSQTQTVQNAPGATIIQGGAGSVFNINSAKNEVAPTQPGLAGDLARLRHAGEKRFWAWWESCFDTTGRPKPTDPERRSEVEQVRTQIYDKLEHERGAADAVFFNTPRMNEPFPENSTLRFCPEGIEIKQFGYKLDRLGEIIDRIQRGQ
jgi:hypothetical protein